MLKHLLKHKWFIVVIVGLMIAEPSINSVLNFWLQKLFNSASPGGDKIILLRYLTAGFLFWILKRIVAFSLSVIKARFICSAKQDVKHRMFVNLMGLNTSNISDIASSGEYISTFTNDITLLETRFYNQVLGLFGAFFSIAIMGTSFFVLNAKLAAAICAFGVVSMFVPVVFSKKLNEKNLRYSDKISQFTQRIKEYTVAYPTIKNYSIEHIIAERFGLINRETEDAKFEADYSLSLADNIGVMLSWFMQFIGIGFGLMLVLKGEIMVGTVVAAQSFAGDLASPLQNIIVNVNSIRSVSAIVKKLKTLSGGGDAAEKRGEKTDESAAVPDFLQTEGCDISFDHFSLQLGQKQVIDDFSFDFETGKKYLVIGLNGSGKSTLFKSLKKWYNVSTGAIRLNGVSVDELSSDDISRAVSYLNENVSLFSGSVKENISLFRECGGEVFYKAVKDAQVRLELDREIIDEGRNISSGEQRRIEIARSLLESVRVLVFDEVVSTLDIETAYEIEDLALSFESKTVIFISHNFSGKLIKRYDEILVMEDGRLLAHGSYDELTESCPYFKRICSIKFGN